VVKSSFEQRVINRDLIIAMVVALACHAAALSAFRIQFIESAPPNKESYLKVILVASDPEIPSAHASEIAASVPVKDSSQIEGAIPILEPAPTIETPKPETKIVADKPDSPFQFTLPPPTNRLVETSAFAAKTSSFQTTILPQTENRVKFAEQVVRKTAASYINLVKPTYPSKARRSKQEGTVIVGIYISAVGKIDQVEVLESSGFPLLDEAALDAAKRSRFRPAYFGNQPIKSKVEAPYSFMLTDG
jgi:protein TonB